MVRLKIKAKKLKRAISAVSSIVSMGNLHIDEDKIKIRDLDLSHTCFVDLEINNEDFSSYEAEEEEDFMDLGNYMVPLNLRELRDSIEPFPDDTLLVLGGSHKKDTLNISSIEDMFSVDIDLLKVQHEGHDNWEPCVQLPLSFSLPITPLIRTIRHIGNSYELEIQCHDGLVELHGRGGNLESSLSLEVPSSSHIRNCIYPMKWFKKMIWGEEDISRPPMVRPAREIEFSIGYNAPLRLEFPLFGSDVSRVPGKSRIEYWVAPRFREDLEQ